MLGQAGQVEGHQVRGLADFQGARFGFQPQCSGTVEGGHAQGAVGIQRRGRAGNGLGEQGGGAGFAQQVQVIVAGRAIGADGDVDPGLPQALHRAEATGQLEVGFRAMDDAAVAFYQQCQVFFADLRHMNGLEAWPEQAQARQAGQWSLAALFGRLLYLERGFMNVHVNRGVQFLGDHPDFLEVFVTNGVGCMRAEGNVDARVMLEVAEQLDTLADGLIGVAGTGNRKVEDRNGDLGANAAVVHALTGNFREEIHVRETGDATFDLLGNGQVRAVAHECFVDPFALGRPDVLFQPGHQGQIIGQAAEQGHRRMPVGIDQAGAEQHARQFADFGCVKLQRGGPRADKHDAPVADAQAMLFEDNASGFDGYQPGRQQ
ncbi:hypothetical protein D3C84_658090 [compost metagenome]